MESKQTYKNPTNQPTNHYTLPDSQKEKQD